MKKMSILIAITFLILPQLNAQFYEKQITALQQSFEKKDVSLITDYLSENLKIDPVPADRTILIIGNLMNNFPEMDEIRIVEAEKGRARIRYVVANGDEMSESNKALFADSFIYFDDQGKITGIEIFEKIIKRGIERQKKMANSVQLPDPGDLVDKYPVETIEFPAEDELLITGDLYDIGRKKPVILLCHQGGYNRLEFIDIARKLNELGFNCLAIDLRSGGEFAGEPNQTHQRAQKKGLNPEMIDARQDITAAISYLKNQYKQKVIVVGSSFSASLALLEGASNRDIKAVISFSPGNYFGKAAPKLNTVIPEIKVPVLITSSQEESSRISKWFEDIETRKDQSQFIPKSEGLHGARVLWNGQKGADEYWSAVKEFLIRID